LTTGKVVDTNSSFIADKLFSLGLEVVAILKVGDTKKRLHWALRHALELGELIIGTGGLGPTKDDLTTETVSEFFERELELHDDIAQALKKRFESRGHPWTANNLKQARFPKGAEIIPNPQGTAPGFRMIGEDERWLIWLSGVPREMADMMENTVLPWIAQVRKPDGEIAACTFKIYGLTESKLDDLLKPICLPPQAKLSFRAHYPDLSLRLTLMGDQKGRKKFQDLKKQIQKLIGPYIYGAGEETLEEIIGRLLQSKAWTLALAESCTGGYISHRMTSVAGSSEYFLGSVVAYSNDAKMGLLGVNGSTLERFGAVSREIALEMAEGIRRCTGATVGLSTTGVAGPMGETPRSPVGTVWLGLALPQGSESRHFTFQGNRERVIQGSSQAALYWIRTALL
jgi:nicotinamide-nucleotide amidase